MGCSSTRLAYLAISMVDYSFLTLLVLIGTLLVVFLFRKRLKAAILAGFLTEGFVALDTMLFRQAEIEVDGKTVTQNVLTPWAAGFLSKAAPILVSEGMKAIKLKVPQNLPVNAAGELDFMAPVLQKLASGKKVKIEDFLPVIMEKAMPYLEGFLGKMADSQGKGGAAKSKESGKIGL